RSEKPCPSSTRLSAIAAKGEGARRPGSEADQLDIEHERSPGRARTPGRIAVRELARDPEPRLFALDHELNALGPARDDLVQAEGRRLAARERAIEELTVRGPAGVVHGHLVGRPRMPRAGPRREDAVREARRRPRRVG